MFKLILKNIYFNKINNFILSNVFVFYFIIVRTKSYIFIEKTFFEKYLFYKTFFCKFKQIYQKKNECLENQWTLKMSA